MAVEFWYTGVASIAAAVIPVTLYRWSRLRGQWAVALTVPAALMIGEVVFRIIKPDFHHGPLYPLGVIMTGFIALMIAVFVVGLLNLPAKP